MTKSALALLLATPLALLGCADKGDDSGATDDTASMDGMWTLTVTGTGYTPHDGNAYEIAVVDASDNIVASDSGTHTGDTINWTFTDALSDGASYNVDFYFDFDGSGSCDSPGTDHAWRYSIGPITADETLTEDHDTDFTDVCATFAR